MGGSAFEPESSGVFHEGLADNGAKYSVKVVLEKIGFFCQLFQRQIPVEILLDNHLDAQDSLPVKLFRGFLHFSFTVMLHF